MDPAPFSNVTPGSSQPPPLPPNLLKDVAAKQAGANGEKIERRGGFRPSNPGGRPRKDAAEQIRPTHTTPTQKPLVTPEDEAQADFFGGLITDLLEVTDKAVIKKALRLGSRAGFSPAELTELKDAIGMGSIQKEAIPKSARRLALKYTLLGKFGDELLIATALAMYGIGVSSTLRDLKMAVDTKEGRVPPNQNGGGSAPLNGAPPPQNDSGLSRIVTPGGKMPKDHPDNKIMAQAGG